MLDSDFIYPDRAKDNAIPRFFMKAVKMEKQSSDAGRPIFVEQEYVEILIPGDRNTQVIRKVQDGDKSRWPAVYTAFKENRAVAVSGTPIEQWPPVDRAQVEMLKHFNVRTVEDLAAVTDNALPSLGMGARELRTKAKLYIEEALRGTGVSKLARENEELRGRLAALEAQLTDVAARYNAAAKEEKPAEMPDDMMARMEAMIDAKLSGMPVKRGLGRPPKVRDDEASPE